MSDDVRVGARYQTRQRFYVAYYVWDVVDTSTGWDRVVATGLYPVQEAVLLCERLNREAEREVAALERAEATA